MRALRFKAKYPYEIGDRVRFEKGGEMRVMEITDIVRQASEKTGRIKIILELDGWYKLDTDLHVVDMPRV